VHILSGLQGQGVHKWNLPSPYSVRWVFRSCILPSCLNSNFWYFQTLLITQFDWQVVVYVFRSLHHEMYLMPTCRIVQPSEILSRELFKDDRKNAKKIIYFYPLFFLFYCLQFPLFHSFNYLYLPLFSFAHFPPFNHLTHCPIILVLFLIITAITSHR